MAKTPNTGCPQKSCLNNWTFEPLRLLLDTSLSFYLEPKTSELNPLLGERDHKGLSTRGSAF